MGTFVWQSMKLLSVMAAVRLDDESDNIEKTISRALGDNTNANSGVTDRSIQSFDPLASSSWDEVMTVPHICFNTIETFLVASLNFGTHLR